MECKQTKTHALRSALGVRAAQVWGGAAREQRNSPFAARLTQMSIMSIAAAPWLGREGKRMLTGGFQALIVPSAAVPSRVEAANTANDQGVRLWQAGRRSEAV